MCPARPCRAGGAAVSPSLASTLFLTGTWEPRHLASDHRRCDIWPGGGVGDEGIGAALDMVAAAGRHVEDMASSARTPAVGASVPLGPAPRRTLFVFLLRPWPSRGAGALPRPSLRCCFVNRHPRRIALVGRSLRRRETHVTLKWIAGQRPSEANRPIQSSVQRLNNSIWHDV